MCGLEKKRKGMVIMMNSNRKFIDEKTIKQLVGKKVLFKLIDDEDDEGLIGLLKKYDNDLIIEREGLDLVIAVYELYDIQECSEKSEE